MQISIQAFIMKKRINNKPRIDPRLKIDMTFEEAIQKTAITPKEKVEKLMKEEKSKKHPKKT